MVYGELVVHILVAGPQIWGIYIQFGLYTIVASNNYTPAFRRNVKDFHHDVCILT
jgi:hypothetical protein